MAAAGPYGLLDAHMAGQQRHARHVAADPEVLLRGVAIADAGEVLLVGIRHRGELLPSSSVDGSFAGGGALAYIKFWVMS